MNIILMGDSIFDNAPYVQADTAVSDQLARMAEGAKVTLLAVDGDVTTDVVRQLDAIPSDATHLFVSCGGNDALQYLPLLGQHVNSVGEAMDLLYQVTGNFRTNYQQMLG